jgi:hypothetical protein
MLRRLRAILPAGLACLVAAPLAAQSTPRPPSAAAVRRAVETITETDVRDRIAVIADDSMRGRPTPSPELDRTAAYIAAEFQRLGLRPGGDSGTFIQRYRIRRTQLDSSSYVMAMGRGTSGRWVLGREATLFQGAFPDSAVTAPAVLVVGLPADTARPFGDVNVRGTIILQTISLAQLQQRQLLQAEVLKGNAAGVRGWVFLLDVPAPLFGGMGRGVLNARFEIGGGQDPTPVPVMGVRDSSAAELLRAAGEDLAALHDSTARGVRAMQGFTVTVSGRRRVISETSAPNVIGILEGSDPRLRNEYVFFTGHMDHTGAAGGGAGCTAVGADSICNGADDDASGTAGVVELAEAFATLTPRPRRTLVFMTVSGEERGLWGSGYYADNPVVPLAQTVADLNMDMIGRYHDNRPGWRDTIVVIGKEHSSLGEVADRVTREHRELGMQLIDDIWPSQNFYQRSDHINFARNGVPILFFFNGAHPDYHRPSDSVEKIDAEKAARIVRMVFYIGLEVANATQRPQWNPESRRRVVQAGN